MRSSTRKSLILGAFAVTALAWSGCEAKKQTEYVAGVSTQVQVPRDLKAIRIDVSVGGVVQFCRGYRVYEGRVELPRSLGEIPQNDEPSGEPITVSVSGFTEDFQTLDGRDVFANCFQVAPKVGDPGQGTRILRRSRQPYVKDKILFLPMPLKYSCFDHKDCDLEEKTCKAGRCVDAAVDPSKLPDYSEELVDGTGGACFSSSFCFSPNLLKGAGPAGEDLVYTGGVPPAVVNASDCTYAVPNSPPSSPPQLEGVPPNPFPKGAGEGLNIEVTYDSGLNREILDKDREEGFFIPDPAKPQQFRLAEGLCDLVKGFTPAPPTPENPDGTPTQHRITAIRVSTNCRSKTPFQPLCSGDQLAAMGVNQAGVSANPAAPAGCKPTELKPPKAALIVLTDDTKNSELFYSQAGTQGVALSLSDPAFQKTELGLQFFPGPGNCAAPGSFGLAVQPKLARLIKDEIIGTISAHNQSLGALDVPVNLDGALRDAYAFLAQPKYQTEYYRRGVLVIGNRGFEQSTCTAQTPAVRAAAARAASKIDTYVLMLARNLQIADPNAPVAMAQELAVAGGTTQAYDARSNKAPAQDAFQKVVNDIATCVYDVVAPTPRPNAGDTLSYTDPINPFAPTVNLPFNAACNAEQVAGAGFGVDPTNPNRTFLCKNSCDAYRTVLRNASLYAAQNLQPAIAVPIFVHRAGCSPTAGNTSAGSAPPPGP